MAWRRHNRNITHEVFYDGTTIDGSRLEKGMRDIEGAFNDVPIGDMAQRFVAVQYHSGWLPPEFSITQSHHWPWMEIRNEANTDTYGVLPIGAPFNELRFKGTFVPGVALNVGGTRVGTQYAWTRTFTFLRPVIIESMNLFMMVDQMTAGRSEYMGTDTSASINPYTYTTPAPSGYTAGNSTSDVVVLVDVFNPTTKEDAEMTDVEYSRHRWVVNNDPFTFILSNRTNAGPAWDDMFPVFENNNNQDCKTLQGRLVEDLDLNIPIPAGSKVRVAVVIPKYDGTVVGDGSWGAYPWALQGWSTTLTVLEEVRDL